MRPTPKNPEPVSLAADLCLPRKITPRVRIAANFWQAFSLKRRCTVTFLSRGQRDVWLIFLESRPSVVTFCERPEFTGDLAGGPPFDFWLLRRAEDGSRRSEMLTLSGRRASCKGVGEDRARWCQERGFEHTVIEHSEIVRQRCWLSNWRQIQPFLGSLSEQPWVTGAVVAAFSAARTASLGEIEDRVRLASACACSATIRAHIFLLLQRGVIAAPELESRPLSTSTALSIAAHTQPTHEP